MFTFLPLVPPSNSKYKKETLSLFTSLHSTNLKTPDRLQQDNNTPSLMSKSKNMKTPNPSQFTSISSTIYNDDDDFQDPIPSLPFTQTLTKPTSSIKLKPSNTPINRPSKKPKKTHTLPGKENLITPHEFDLDPDLGLESFEPTVLCNKTEVGEKKKKLTDGFGYLSNSIESRLSLQSRGGCAPSKVDGDLEETGTTQLDVLLDLCYSEEEKEIEDEDVGGVGEIISCPMCGSDISNMSDEMRQVHTNECLDKEPIDIPDNDHVSEPSGQVLDDPPNLASSETHHVSPISIWLQNLGLSRYEEVFIREEIDWDSLKWLTDEDLCKIGVTALGPRKKIVHAISELRTESHEEVNIPEKSAQKESKTVSNKLITDFFPGFAGNVKKSCTTGAQAQVGKTNSNNGNKRSGTKMNFSNNKFRDTPSWCSITGTPFRVDAFKYLRRDCFHWFLTHFHADHYGGLTKSFCHGKIYCSLITAKLVNLKIGIPWEKIEVLPLNQKINIAGVDVTCFDANHCPGAVIILFEPPNGKAILHTGDFRFNEDMTKIASLQTRVHTLVLDTTYCDPQYDFPKQEAVIQYVLEAIQAEAFNPKTLFLIGSYTIGKERVFMEVARVLQKKIYVTAAKMRVLECLGMPKEDMQWLTLDERESHIHVVPMWTLANFKRLKHVANMYMGRYSLIVAFSPTGWSFSKGKKSSPGKRWQQGTIIRYEVPYSEHSSFTELKKFVKFISPENIIPSVNNHGSESVRKMVSLLSS
ncbi:putative sterile alpha motif domain, DNA repair metallo-beta-lactamase [Helianthus annuus]|uniref:Sterile alpha motif domain, DNA repair metallo-beta-lactamase n=1 Tax=Helianthus annuus TaxID=4232 RepID=A0A9K3ENM2_HELAN|nr:putative sterile alpha motif domain, DNA repair metallo-beta-lactamase [Helianthus annuus]